MKTKPALRWILLLILATSTTSVVVEGLEEGAEDDGDISSSSEDNQEKYFYRIDPNSPVVEYAAPPEGELDKPDFIYNPKPGIRIVEFYAHW
jgi:hypothetical protein